ncbi:MAG: right-handed parallel beta-helix repeat-containing protein [Clostridia bacterium]|nr:right-handed parallel beta-helix repeat-containing protein [Clostridia bacterium]
MNSIFNILDFGAAADGITNNAPAIQKAVDAASENGGTVLIPPGRFLSGTVRLRSNIDFHLSNGAVLIGSLNEDDVSDFNELRGSDDLPWTGGCFLFAKDESNITISGAGTICGQGEKVFFDDNADGGFNESPLNVKPFRPRTTFFENITNLTVRDITIKDAARWTLHMAGCTYVNVDGIKILNNIRGANNDGIDCDCCKHVTVSNCLVETGDDAVVIKSVEAMSRLYGGSENIVVKGCILASRDSAVKIGTETHGDIRNIIISDCIVRGCSRGIGIWVRDGAAIENIHIHHITGNVLRYAGSKRPKGQPGSWWGQGEPVFINSTYRNTDRKFPGIIRNVTMDHICLKAESSIFIAGEEESVISHIRMTDMDITLCRQGTQEHGSFDEQPSPRGIYPHSIPVVYGRFAHDLYIQGRVKYEKPYTKEKNVFCEFERCTHASVEISDYN